MALYGTPSSPLVRQSHSHSPDPERFGALNERTFLLSRQSTTGRSPSLRPRKDNPMLMTVAVILIVLWLLGMVTSYTMGGLIHILLVVAIIVILIRVIQGRRVV
jgi:hypothetical protein